MPDETKESAIAFLNAALAHYPWPITKASALLSPGS
jgi:hypothetical protein